MRFYYAKERWCRHDMDKWELAFKDYENGMKYKDIAEKYNVSINTVKSWKSRKWNAPPNQKVAHKKEKGCTQKELQPVIENDELTEQQKMFCLFYLQHFNATKAYQQAYQVSYQVANSIGYRLLVNDGIKKELHRLKAELQQDTFVDVKDLIQEYVKQFSADITDIVKVNLTEYEVKDKFKNVVHDKDGNVIKGHFNEVLVSSSEDFDGSIVKKISQGKDGVTVELYDKQKAMSELMKYLDVDALKKAQTEKAQAEAAIIKNKAAKLTGGGKASELLQALLDVKSGGNGNGDNLQRETD